MKPIFNELPARQKLTIIINCPPQLAVASTKKV